MIVLDTNVVSEMTKVQPDSKVLAWMNSQIFENLHLTSITVAELRFGIRALPEGSRRNALEAAFARTLGFFEGRILPFDQDAALAYADLAAAAGSAGQTLGLADAYIGAITLSRHWTLATRDGGLLGNQQVDVINPWA